MQVRSLGETVRLDARTKLLNPKWYEGMLNSGYEGVREIQKRLTNTVGWSATSGQVSSFGPAFSPALDHVVNPPQCSLTFVEQSQMHVSCIGSLQFFCELQHTRLCSSSQCLISAHTHKQAFSESFRAHIC